MNSKTDFFKISPSSIKYISCGNSAPCVFVYSSGEIQLYDTQDLIIANISLVNNNSSNCYAMKQLVELLFVHYWDSKRIFIDYDKYWRRCPLPDFTIDNRN